MNEVWFYSLLSVILISIVSLVGIFTLSLNVERLKRFLIYLLAFSAGALLGDSFIHILPEISDFSIPNSGLLVLGGIVLFFAVEKFIHWQHCHMPITKKHVHRFAYMNLVGDGIHNFIDGMVIASSYIISVPLGVATTIAVVLHEIPQEIGDFGVLLHGGFSRLKALGMNFITALSSVIGALVVLIFGSNFEGFHPILLGIAAGGFIYIAGADLIPELHKESGWKKSLLQLISFVAGIGVMALLLLME